MRIPKINLKELRKMKEKNFQERLEFIDAYARWVKSQPNRKWSSRQKDIIGSRD